MIVFMSQIEKAFIELVMDETRWNGPWRTHRYLSPLSAM